MREAARLQGFPDWFDFLDQASGQSYKQLGNAVNIGVVYNVIKAQVLRDIALLEKHDQLIQSILTAPLSPTDHLKSFTNNSSSAQITPKTILTVLKNLG